MLPVAAAARRARRYSVAAGPASDPAARLIRTGTGRAFHTLASNGPAVTVQAVLGSRRYRVGEAAENRRSGVVPVSPGLRVRGRSAWVLLASAISTIALSACGGQGSSTAGSSPAQLLHTALSDAGASGSVHETESVKLSAGREKFSDDVAVHEGRQAITVHPGEVAHVLVVHGQAYISGKKSVLTAFFGFSKLAARAIGSRWLSIPSTSRGYSTVAYDATLATALDGLFLRGPLTETAPATIDGTSVVGIQGDVTLPGTPGSVATTVYVSRASKPLPVGATYSFSTGASGRIAFSHWGEPLSLRPPARVIAQGALQPVPSRSGPSPSRPATLTRRQIRAQNAAWEGYWLATGRVFQAHDSAAQVPGEVIRRLWRIARRCAGLRCSLELEREVAGPTANTLGVPLIAPLIGASDGWRASFTEPGVVCQGASAVTAGVEDSRWRITQPTAGTILALETTRTTGPDCKTGTSKILWTARRVSLHPSDSA